ncbi:Flagellar basal-body rod protein FlgF [Brevinematales bacterium NS]|nr:flagellar basal-body rod protein FlgF [Brevinematales bacterium]QJR22037.1 Flagellar basal-body rod protein FlgF [Brevinematales bacterium NS]
MVRSIFTGASGMMVTMEEMNTVANNLANVNTDGYKRETSVTKAFPEMLIRRINDDGVVKFPLGSYDLAPVVGKLGTGVEFNESYIRFEQGSLLETENDFDLALEGDGFFTVMTEQGERYTRNGNFNISVDGYLVDKHGNRVMGEKGFIRIARNNFKIDQEGNVYVNLDYSPEDFVDKAGNEWKNMTLIDRLKIVDFPERRYLAKEGYTWYRETDFSGPATIVPENKRPKVIQGALEKSNVDPVVEMVRMIEINRLYEANQKSIQTADETLAKAVGQVGRGLA